MTILRENETNTLSRLASRYYVVRDYQTGDLQYAGRSSTSAAIALDPGTVYGSHEDPGLSHWICDIRAEQARELVQKYGVLFIPDSEKKDYKDEIETTENDETGTNAGVGPEASGEEEKETE